MRRRHGSGRAADHLHWRRRGQDRQVLFDLRERPIGVRATSGREARLVFANPGDWGIDVLVGDLNSSVSVWQAKYFVREVGASQQDQIRSSFASAVRAAARHGYVLDRWVLCIPVSLDGPATQWWEGWKARHERSSGVDIELWDETKLRELLLRRESADVYRHYYALSPEGRKPRISFGTQPRARLAIIAGSVVVAVGGIAAGLALASPSYVNLDTGPGSGISVATSGKACGNTPQNGLRSPAATKFSAISLTNSQVLDGSEIRVYQGTYDGKSYDWLQADITGNSENARLYWYVPPHFKYRYWCNMPIPDRPIMPIPAQVATVAIPTIIDGKQITFQACIWHSAPFSEECSSILP
jgi:hypothetical protein